MKNHHQHPIIFIVGGARSGKSRYGEELAIQLSKEPIYVATAEIIDEEMSQRVAHHKKRREEYFSKTVEEPLELAKVIKAEKKSSVLLVDCLSVYLGNLFYHEQPSLFYTKLDELYHVLEHTDKTIILISNEVGEGIVPDNELSRTYRDAHGWMNQKVASIADVVIKMTCGIPQYIKGDLV